MSTVQLTHPGDPAILLAAAIAAQARQDAHALGRCRHCGLSLAVCAGTFLDRLRAVGRDATHIALDMLQLAGA